MGTYQTSRSSCPSSRSATAALSARSTWSLLSACPAPSSTSPGLRLGQQRAVLGRGSSRPSTGYSSAWSTSSERPSYVGSAQRGRSRVVERDRVGERGDPERLGGARAGLDQHQPGVAGVLAAAGRWCSAPSRSVDVTSTVVPASTSVASSASASRTTVTSTPWSSSTRASAWAPPGSGLAGSSERRRAASAPPATSSDRDRGDQPGRRPAASRRCRRRPARAHERPASASSRARTLDRLRGRGRPVAVPHRVEERGGAVDPLPLPGMRGADGDRDLVRGRAGQVVEQAALDLADGERAEAVDDRVARCRPSAQRPLGALPQLARGDRLVGEDRVAARGRPGRYGGRGTAASPSPVASTRNATMASERGQRRRVGRGVDGAVDEPVEPVQQLLEEVAARGTPGATSSRWSSERASSPDGSSGGSDRSRGGDPGLGHQLDVVRLLAHPLVEVLQRGDRRGERRR